MTKGIADSIIALLRTSSTRIEFIAKIADLVRQSRNYRWVGIYEVGPEEVSIIAYSGPDAPAYPKFPITKGLTGSAILERRAVIVGDVRKDPRYLTAFGSTLSEIIIPVLDEKSGEVVGTIDVESELADAFSAEDQKLLETWAQLLATLVWCDV